MVRNLTQPHDGSLIALARGFVWQTECQRCFSLRKPHHDNRNHQLGIFAENRTQPVHGAASVRASKVANVRFPARSVRIFDRAKERDPERADHVLMLDARNIYRKVSRAIYDFAPEQQKNIAAIVWLYRGQADRFLKLVESYIAQAIADGQTTAEPLADYDRALGKLIDLVQPFVSEKRDPDPLAETWGELTGVRATLAADIAGFDAEVAARGADWAGAERDNTGLHAARAGLPRVRPPVMIWNGS